MDATANIVNTFFMPLFISSFVHNVIAFLSMEFYLMACLNSVISVGCSSGTSFLLLL